jgi:hypothetical protein
MACTKWRLPKNALSDANAYGLIDARVVRGPDKSAPNEKNTDLQFDFSVTNTGKLGTYRIIRLDTGDRVGRRRRFTPDDLAERV